MNILEFFLFFSRATCEACNDCGPGSHVAVATIRFILLFFVIFMVRPQNAQWYVQVHRVACCVFRKVSIRTGAYPMALRQVREKQGISKAHIQYGEYDGSKARL